MTCIVNGCENAPSGSLPVCNPCWVSVPVELTEAAYEAYRTNVGRPWAADAVLAWLEGRQPRRPFGLFAVAGEALR